MAILKLKNKIVAIFVVMIAFPIHANECKSIPTAILIDDWIGDSPKKAELQIYKADNKFIEKTKSAMEYKDIQLYRSNSDNLPTLRVDFSELKSDKLPINSDFILILDDKIEYRFSEIEPPIMRFGCPISGKVNDCSFQRNSPVMAAKFKCGKQIMKK